MVAAYERDNEHADYFFSDASCSPFAAFVVVVDGDSGDGSGGGGGGGSGDGGVQAKCVRFTISPSSARSRTGQRESRMLFFVVFCVCRKRKIP